MSTSPLCIRGAASYVQAELKSVGEKLTASNISATFELPDYLKATPSPSLLKREVEKTFKYSRLITVAAKQAKDKKRLQCPTFNPLHCFRFRRSFPSCCRAPGMVGHCVCQEVLCEKAQGSMDARVDMVRSFRQKFKLSVQLVAASGLGSMLLTSGQPVAHGSL